MSRRRFLTGLGVATSAAVATGYGLTVWQSGEFVEDRARQPRRVRRPERSAGPRRPHARRRRARRWKRRAQHRGTDRPTPTYRDAAADACGHERDRARRLRRPPPRSSPSSRRATRRGRSRSSKASAIPTRISRTSRRSPTGGRARRARVTAPGGSVGTSTAPSGSTTRSPRSASVRSRRPRSSATSRSRRRSPTRPGSSRRCPGWVDTADDLIAAWGKFTPASPDPASLLGQVQEAIHLTVKARSQLDADLAQTPERRRGRATACTPTQAGKQRSTVSDSLRLAAQLVVVEAPAAGDLRERARRLRHPPGSGRSSPGADDRPRRSVSIRSSPRSTPRARAIARW